MGSLFKDTMALARWIDRGLSLDAARPHWLRLRARVLRRLARLDVTAPGAETYDAARARVARTVIPGDADGIVRDLHYYSDRWNAAYKVARIDIQMGIRPVVEGA